MTKLLVNNIKIALTDGEQLAIQKAKGVLSKEGLNPRDFDCSIYKKSIDARDKSNIILVYSVLAASKQEIPVSATRLKRLDDDALKFEYGTEVLCGRPVVVGMGPAGMFCALILAENGYRPIIIDRGDNVKDRARALARFIEEGVLDTDSNIQFGAGGAGTFSDGKLTTRINDPKCSYVLSRFVELGAPQEILTKAKPHIGTDNLVTVVNNILTKIAELGGEVVYRCKLTDIKDRHDQIELITSRGNISAGAVVLAIGHSARDTYRMLLSRGMIIQPKPFSVGVRVEHLREDIDKALYGDFAGHEKLGPGEYNLSDTKGGRGVYTFCMCPGGEVVPATSYEGGVCVNGMSRYLRDGKNSNCAVNVSVFTEDYGNDPIKAIEFQEQLERMAYVAGGGDYSAPIQLMGDFLDDKITSSPSRIFPTYANGSRTTVTNINNILPPYISSRLREGFRLFDRRIPGFAVPDAVLTGTETRTSAPLRIMRTERLNAISNPLIYPCGEGAGYAGGIMSSAVDGIKVALEIIKKYKN